MRTVRNWVPSLSLFCLVTLSVGCSGQSVTQPSTGSPRADVSTEDTSSPNGSPNGDAGSSTNSLSVTSFQKQLFRKAAKSSCQGLRTCPNNLPLSRDYSVLLNRYGTVDQCTDGLLQWVKGRNAHSFVLAEDFNYEMSKALDANLFEFNAKEAQTCLDQVQKVDSCKYLLRMSQAPSRFIHYAVSAAQSSSEACKRAIVPKKEIGQGCMNSYQCKPTAEGKRAYCKIHEAGYETCAGKCKKVPDYDESEAQSPDLKFLGKGESCDRKTKLCKPGLVCDVDGLSPDETGLIAKSRGTCTEPKQRGEECWLYEQCAPNLYCHRSEGGDIKETPGTCKPQVSKGQSCGEPDIHRDGVYPICKSFVCGQSGVCIAPKTADDQCIVYPE